MTYSEFIEVIKRQLREPKTAKEIISAFAKDQNQRKIYRFINRALKERELIFITNRNVHPKRFPIKFYFINTIKKL